MLPEKTDADTAWHRRLGRRLFRGEVAEDRARGAYLNTRIAWVLGLSLTAAIVLVGGVYVVLRHGGS